MFGPGADEPLVAYLVTSTGTSRLWYAADERGSIVRLSGDNGVAGGVGKTFGYTSENLLTSATGSVTLGYDPAMRLYQVVGAATTRFGYDGVNLIDEYDGSNSLQRRFAFGPGTDEALVWYEGSGTSDRRFLHADERGSIVAVSNGSGAVTNVDTYDEYGKPGSGNVGRFQYTGQKWIVELGLYDYKARMYHPSLPRFLQTDPIGYGGGMNLYGGMGGDPVNRTDPLGTCVYGWFSDHEITFNKDGSVTDHGEDPATRTGQGWYGCSLDDLFGSDSGAGGIQLYAGAGGGGQPPRAGILNRIYRAFVADVCKGKGTNERGTSSGYDPYDLPPQAVAAGVALGLAKHGHGATGSEFNDYYQDPINLTIAIEQAVQTNPLYQPLRGYRYTVDLGRIVGYDRRHGGDTNYITVAVKVRNDVGTITTVYPGCP